MPAEVTQSITCHAHKILHVVSELTPCTCSSTYIHVVLATVANDSQSGLPHNVDCSAPSTPLSSHYIHSLLYTHSSQWEAITSREKEFLSLASKAPVDPDNVDCSAPSTPLSSHYIHSLLYTHNSQWEAITSREKEFLGYGTVFAH